MEGVTDLREYHRRKSAKWRANPANAGRRRRAWEKQAAKRKAATLNPSPEAAEQARLSALAREKARYLKERRAARAARLIQAAPYKPKGGKRRATAAEKVQRRQYRASNRDALRAYNREQRAADPEGVRARQREAYYRSRDRLRADPVAYAAHRERKREIERLQREKHHAQMLERNRERYNAKSTDPRAQAQRKKWRRALEVSIQLDPQRKARRSERCRAYYLATIATWRADPVKYAAQIERQRERERGYRAASLARLRADPQRLAAVTSTRKQRATRKRAQDKLRTSPKHAETMLAAIARMIPKSLHPELRGDLCNDLIADVLAGSLTVDQIPLVIKQYARKAAQVMSDEYMHVSLDEEMPGMEGVRRGDLIQSDAVHF